MASKPKFKTLQQIIDYKSVYSMEKYSEISETPEGVSFISKTLFDEYFGMIEPYIQRVSVTDAHRVYNYNPALLSRMLYDTPHLDWMLLKINHATEYTFVLEDKINYIHAEDIKDIFDLLATKRK